MKITDKASSLLTQGVATVGRVSRQQTLKAEIGALEKKKMELYSALSEKLFVEKNEILRSDASTAPLFNSIESINTQIRVLNNDLSALIDEQAMDGESPLFCTSCGNPISPSQKFCVYCGEKISN